MVFFCSAEEFKEKKRKEMVFFCSAEEFKEKKRKEMVFFCSAEEFKEKKRKEASGSFLQRSERFFSSKKPFSFLFFFETKVLILF